MTAGDRLRRAPRPDKGTVEAAVARDRARGLAIHPEYGSQPEANSFLRRKHRQRGQLLNQFLAIDGPKGATEAYRDEHERLFGLSPRERAAEAKRRREAEADYNARVAEAIMTGRRHGKTAELQRMAAERGGVVVTREHAAAADDWTQDGVPGRRVVGSQSAARGGATAEQAVQAAVDGRTEAARDGYDQAQMAERQSRDGQAR